MRKKALLFLSLATVVNLVITIVYFVAFLLLTLYFLRDGQTYASLLLLPLLGSIIASFFSYRALLRWADRRWQLYRYLGKKP